MSSSKKQPLARLFTYAGRFKYLTVSSIILSAVSAVLALVPFVYIWRVIQEVVFCGGDFTQAVTIVHNGWMAVFSAIVSMLVYLCALMCSHIAAFRIARNIRTKAVEHITTLPLGVLDSIGSGKVRSIVNDSSSATETFLAHQTPDMAGAIATPVAIVVMLFVFDWRLGLASLIPVFLSFAVMAKMTGKRMATKMEEYKNALADMNNEAVEYIRGVPVVKTFGQTVFSFSRFRDSIERYRKWVIAYTANLRTPMMWYTLGINSVFVFLIFVSLYITGNLNSESAEFSKFVSDLIFYIIFTPIITVTLNKIMFSSENNMIVTDAMNRIDSLLNIKPLTEVEKGKEEKIVTNNVCIENVSFSYADSSSLAVKNINLTIPSGKTYALVGPSGGGKTTLASLISRFWDVTSGSIKIGGADIRSVSKEKLMDTVSYVFQDSHLLKMSIFENVRLGKPEATETEVRDALSKAQCDDIIAKLPDGIHSVYGSKGIYLSGGECQRIAIARTILKDSPIIVLDEATAFADPENEYLVQKAFSSLSKNKTVIKIAHRLTTVVDADTICVLNKGEIVEKGNHTELLAKNGLYKKMWDEYQTSINWKIGSLGGNR